MKGGAADVAHYLEYSPTMQGRVVSFGVGLLAGLGVGIGYLRSSRQFRGNDDDVITVAGEVDSREQLLFK